jgi:hypothetical protein
LIILSFSGIAHWTETLQKVSWYISRKKVHRSM